MFADILALPVVAVYDMFEIKFGKEKQDISVPLPV
jgi:hypothetical protein